MPNPRYGYSTTLFSSDGQLLGARLAPDEQWRFIPSDSLPQKYISAITVYEDQYFFYHPGINPISLWRALRQNWRAGKIVSGGSTLTMQAIRLRHGVDKTRSIFNKSLEMLWALGMELIYSKKNILKDYAAAAPFGTNVVGLEAACWRYFDKAPSHLTWAEAAFLAVLPNSPALIHPGRNRDILHIKRDALLNKMKAVGAIDSATLFLSKLEPIPEKPAPLPNIAPHALDFIQKNQPGQNFNSSIDIQLQLQINDIAQWSYDKLSANEINNLAIIVADTRTGAVLSYCGNAPNTLHQMHVDNAQAPRSTGSILKPFLYAGALDKSVILPGTILPDIPMVIDGFQPKNFNLGYTGFKEANQALIQSLNIPFVYLLQQYGLEQFHFDLNKLGLHHINKPPGHYGLSLILGGGESSLFDLVGAYAYLGRVLINFESAGNGYKLTDLHPLYFEKSKMATLPKEGDLSKTPPMYSAASIYTTLETLQQLQRPDELGKWESFDAGQSLSWKTGTSFGFRDAWAIGVNANYTIGVWVGNSSGEGRQGLLGIKAAAPILFSVLTHLKASSNGDFRAPLDELVPIVVCRQSGMKMSINCTLGDSILTSRFSNNTLPCPYHKLIYIDPLSLLQVNQSCALPGRLQPRKIFNLPTLGEYYYARSHAEYELIPDFDPRCTQKSIGSNMSMIQPEPNSSFFIPRDENGLAGKIIFKLTHRQTDMLIYWHLDETFIGSTRTFHEMSIEAGPGPHVITVIDSTGAELKCPFNVLSSR